MNESNQIKVLLFCHSSQTQHADLIRNELARIATDDIQITLQIADQTSQIPTHVLDEMNALVVLFTKNLERNKNLYKIIKYIEPKTSLERFFVFIENMGGKKVIFPPLFHTIRAQQHHVFPKPDQLNKSVNWDQLQDDLVSEFKESLLKMVVHLKQEDTSPKLNLATRLKKIWSNPRTIIILVSLLLLTLFGKAAFTLAPEFFTSLQPRQMLVGSAAEPPDMKSLWLNEEFFTLNKDRDWQETNKVKGTNTFSTNLNNYTLNVTAESAIEHAIYRLESIQQWPLDELQGLQASFQLQPLADDGSQAEIVFKIELVESPAYFFSCSAIPAATEGTLKCFVQEPNKKVVVEIPQSISLQEWHTVVLQFVPETYVVRFFLDEKYFGQSTIPSVEYWRDRDFHTSIQVELQDLQKGSFTIQCDNFLLARLK